MMRLLLFSLLTKMRPVSLQWEGADMKAATPRARTKSISRMAIAHRPFTDLWGAGLEPAWSRTQPAAPAAAAGIDRDRAWSSPVVRGHLIVADPRLLPSGFHFP